MQAPAGAEKTKRARAPLGVWLECGLALNLPAVRIVSVGGQVVAEIDELIEAEQFLDLLREARSS